MSLAFTEAPWSQSSWMLEGQSAMALRNKGTKTNGEHLVTPGLFWVHGRQLKLFTSSYQGPHHPLSAKHGRHPFSILKLIKENLCIIAKLFIGIANYTIL